MMAPRRTRVLHAGASFVGGRNKKHCRGTGLVTVGRARAVCFSFVCWFCRFGWRVPGAGGRRAWLGEAARGRDEPNAAFGAPPQPPLLRAVTRTFIPLPPPRRAPRLAAARRCGRGRRLGSCAAPRDRTSGARRQSTGCTRTWTSRSACAASYCSSCPRCAGWRQHKAWPHLRQRATAPCRPHTIESSGGRGVACEAAEAARARPLPEPITTTPTDPHPLSCPAPSSPPSSEFWVVRSKRVNSTPRKS